MSGLPEQEQAKRVARGGKTGYHLLYSLCSCVHFLWAQLIHD